MLRWFEKRLDPFPPMPPAQPPRGLVAFCLHYTRGAGPWLALMGVLGALIAIAELGLYVYLGALVDRLGEHTPATFLAAEGPRLAWMALLVVVALPLLVLLDNMVQMQVLLGNFPMRIRWNVHRYLLRQSMGYFQDEFAGRIATKLMQTSLAVRETVIKLLDVGVYVGVYVVGAMLAAAAADWRLMLPFAGWLLGYALLMVYFVPRMERVSREQADARSDMTGRIVDSYTNIATVKLFSHSRREQAYAREAMDGFLGTVYRQMRLATRVGAGNYALNMALVFAVAGIGLWLWLGGIIGAGAVAVGIALALRLVGMSQWIMWELSALFENVGTVQDGINSISLPPTVDDAPGAPELPDVRGDIRFEGVGFHYGKGSGVIDRLDLDIRAGERIGVIGRSGAGKSTLVNLLLRFHDVESGRILVDGIDIASVQQDSLRARVGVVTQDTSLLHRSVRENILYGRPDAGEAEMLEAARQAEAHDFIRELSDSAGRRGYDAHVGERGVKLSGGQRQRIAIARVLLKDAPILVLDEATSALDSEVEAAIQGNLYRLMEGKTVIAIAHRLSTIAAMDRLIVMDQGAIVEQGTHAELVAAGGIYAQLWARQSGGFIDPGEQTAPVIADVEPARG
ncbi:ABC transporter ATP-binding protein [Luteimonas yindakuii]|uniref:ABC transporter ATP-binding protein n=1 Tax=Luteimonas yindakuii TaxID=2565782 RepID=A0A4Z1R6I5_9GAMM|nr:ABC transporter ATP-binding protein [Luteimonas yindakuii]QCU72675.1 ABC transporter ATP-binding protein [Luteimonas yindakuii]TKS54526.1 ABC transporter ATP-binding protein [Luteimonas yindakuii]